MNLRTGCLLIATLLAAAPASASYTIDLIWSETETPTASVTPSLPGSEKGACARGALAAGHDFTTEWCLEVRLTASAPLTSAILTLGWDQGTSGTAIGRVGRRSFGQYGGGLAPAGPVFPKVTGTGDCAPACDTAFGSFGGAGPSVVPAGVYTIGSISIDMVGLMVGIHDVTAFLRTGVGGATDKKGAAAPVQLNGARFLLSPEPGAAGLLGMGLLGLAAFGPGRRE